MKIYSFPTPNLTKILLAAEEIGEEYTLELLDMTKGEHKTPEHMARHPLGKVPAIEVDGQAFFESNNIVRFIAERNNNALYGDTPEKRAHINQWVDLYNFHIGRWLQVIFFEEKVRPAFDMGEPKQELIDEAKEFLTQQLPVLETQLTKHDFIAGPDITIVDVIALSFFDTVDYTSFDLAQYPKIHSWVETMKSRPSYSKAMASIPGNNMITALIGG